MPHPSPPVAEKRPHTHEAHGLTRSDDYAWLRAENWQEVMRNPETLPDDIRAYLDAENSYCDAVFADTSDLQETLFREMRGRIKEDDSSVPTPDGDWAYFVEYIEGGEYPIICRQTREGDAKAVLLDGNAMAQGLDYFSLGGVAHSPDHTRVAYAVDTNGSEYYTIRVRELATGVDLSDEIKDVSGAVVWSSDGTTLFYTKVDDNHRPYAVARHTIGTPSEQDAEVYREADPAFFVGVSKTLSGAYIVINSHDHEASEIRVLPADAPGSAPRLIEARSPGHEYELEHSGDRFFIHTNSGDAEDFRIVEAPITDPSRSNWVDVEPHRAGRLIIDVSAFDEYLVRLERENGLPRIVIRALATGTEHAIEFDEDAYALGMASGYEHATSTLRFTYSSMTTPSQVFDYDMATRDRTLRKTQQVPSGHNPDDYVTRRIEAPAHDGETVPISLLYRKDTPLDGSAPVLLYGYGSYGISMPASFSTSRLSLVDRGFVYAIAHIRGGKEKGYRWYTSGKREQKTNTFKDFISAGEHLVAEGYTERGRIVGEGGSAGGMLMGAVANMAPDLFAGITAYVPFVDCLTTILDDTLPLTPPEWTEWGNPITSVEIYELMESYSPYDNVVPQPYPAILAVAGLTDPRVTYWEPAKWVARLRVTATNSPLIAMKMNMSAGHGGASGRFERLKETALGYAFALKATGHPEASVTPGAAV